MDCQTDTLNVIKSAGVKKKKKNIEENLKENYLHDFPNRWCRTWPEARSTCLNSVHSSDNKTAIKKQWHPSNLCGENLLKQSLLMQLSNIMIPFLQFHFPHAIMRSFIYSRGEKKNQKLTHNAVYAFTRKKTTKFWLRNGPSLSFPNRTIVRLFFSSVCFHNLEN